MVTFITKKHLSRRTMLKGMGVSVGLPLLDAMLPAATALAKTTAAARPRMAFVYFPHGAVMDQWTPKADGAIFDLPAILEPLKAFRKQLTVVSGLENKSAVASPVHAITPGTWLSCVPPRISHDPYAGITVDQIAATHLGQDTPLPSLEVATEEQGGEGSCDRNYGGCYGKTISFRTPSAPLPMEHDPRKLFRQLFGQVDSEASVLDLVSREASDLERTLSARDRAALGDYFTTVREIERRVQVPGGFDEHMNLMFDMIALAFQANLTRVATFMMAAEVSNQPYTHIGIPDAFHPLSHHANSPAKLERLAKIQIHHTTVFAKFVQKLQQTNDGEGSMLDHSIILYGSNMSNSHLHDHFPLPSAIVGGGCGRIKGNQHLRYPDRTPIANMHVALLNRAGVPTESFGDSTGGFSEI
jgi:BMFP domain-containing protein YqiC